MVASWWPVLGPRARTLMRTFGRFLLAGLLNSGIGFAIIFFCMLVVGLSPLVSNLIGYAFGLCIAFAMHKWFTFQSEGKAMSEFVRFLPVFLVCYLMNLAALHACIELLGIPPAWSQIVAGLVYVGSSFFLNRILVFSRQAT